jgi:mono/diheme cytochrome c family protein
MWVFALPDDEPRAVPRPTRRDQPRRSIAEGVFTAAQAEQGAQLFEQECRACHDPAIYTGANFAAKWGGATLADVYQDFSLAMPPARAGGLTPATYASILAFFVRDSGYPAGNTALPGDVGALRGIEIGTPAATP